MKICTDCSTARFTQLVWKTLAERVPFGRTVSYAELATLSGGTPRSSRAVGQAMRSNPVLIIVPCHRVVLSSGAVGSFSGGRWNDAKSWLLDHERRCRCERHGDYLDDPDL